MKTNTQTTIDEAKYSVVFNDKDTKDFVIKKRIINCSC